MLIPPKDRRSDDETPQGSWTWPFSPLATIRLAFAVIVLLGTMIFGRERVLDALAVEQQPQPPIVLNLPAIDLPLSTPLVVPTRPAKSAPPVPAKPIGTPVEVVTVLGDTLTVTLKSVKTGIRSTIPEYGKDQNGSGYTVIDLDVMVNSGGRDDQFVMTSLYFRIVGADGTVYPGVIRTGVDAFFPLAPITTGNTGSGSIPFDASAASINGARFEFRLLDTTLAAWQ